MFIIRHAPRRTLLSGIQADNGCQALNNDGQALKH
jgi:hypothetical protein